MKENKLKKMSFMDNHPSLRWFMLCLNKLSYPFSLVFMWFSIIFFSLCTVLVFIRVFPSAYNKIIAPVLSGFITIILIPSITYIFKERNSLQNNQFQQNVAFFEHLIGILLNMRKELYANNISNQVLQNFIIENQEKFALYCSDNLNDNLAILLSESKDSIKHSKKNILAYINACIRCLRKMSGKGSLSYVPKEFSLIKEV